MLILLNYLIILIIIIKKLCQKYNRFIMFGVNIFNMNCECDCCSESCCNGCGCDNCDCC